MVAACTGHAVAAGALMVLACDLRIGVDGPVKIGLNEVAIALTLPPWALALDRLSRRHLQTSVALALLHEVVGHTIERAAELAEYTDRQAYAAAMAV